MSNDVDYYLENTIMTLSDVAVKCGVSDKKVRKIWESYPVEFRKERKRQTYRNSKLGKKNPMLGRKGEKHAQYKEHKEDGRGYRIVLKPVWYTGRKGSSHVFEHSVVMCENLGITEIPSGWCVHHINGVKTDNRIGNLALMKLSAHAALHQKESATTREKSRRPEDGSKREPLAA